MYAIQCIALFPSVKRRSQKTCHKNSAYAEGDKSLLFIIELVSERKPRNENECNINHEVLVSWN